MEVYTVEAFPRLSSERFSMMEKMLKSWGNQTFKIPLYLSMSTSTELVSEAEKRLVTWKSAYPTLTVYLNPKMSQFKHYQNLVQRLKTCSTVTKDSWVIFTDDDDTWHEMRVEEYYVCLGRQDMKNYSVLRLPFKDRIDQEEYWEFSTKLGNLKRFVDRSASRLLDHPFADRYFVRFLTPPSRGTPTLPTDFNLYEYKMGHESMRHAHDVLANGATFEQFREVQVTRDLILKLARWYETQPITWGEFSEAVLITVGHMAGASAEQIANINLIYQADHHIWFANFVQTKGNIHLPL
ncbi:hypothetical protein DFA_02910 [Cavenderia fasciculata]|uniref:Glycosyltransferase n=1 Tax=Cavenderia fasciculata TaxID=261658 RepID=F4PIT7_CACFS|nr:uncharacterized protein DFA_02910 [Cavenderia fasciculata]EGG24666.1 hypothetical protein DFA_02910 [Cavenderia fasciculata]|eukprot:XP_004362517.1 hypothetical protein DFA_02910 [Cavenderia fasciculata]